MRTLLMAYKIKLLGEYHKYQRQQSADRPKSGAGANGANGKDTRQPVIAYNIGAGHSGVEVLLNLDLDTLRNWIHRLYPGTVKALQDLYGHNWDKVRELQFTVEDEFEHSDATATSKITVLFDNLLSYDN